jgi:hypothetical protein
MLFYGDVQSVQDGREEDSSGEKDDSWLRYQQWKER